MLRNRVPAGNLAHWSSEIMAPTYPQRRLMGEDKSVIIERSWDGMGWERELTLNLSLGWYGGERKKKRESEKEGVFIPPGD